MRRQPVISEFEVAISKKCPMNPGFTLFSWATKTEVINCVLTPAADSPTPRVKNLFFQKHLPWRYIINIFTCVALAKAGLVVGPLRPSGRPSVCPSVRNTLGYQVCVICNSKTFHSFLFKLCLMIIHILKMCTSYFVHVS